MMRKAESAPDILTESITLIMEVSCAAQTKKPNKKKKPVNIFSIEKITCAKLQYQLNNKE